MADGLSKTDISNLALLGIGHTKTVGNIDTERSAEATACKTFFPQALDEVLEVFDWPFARRHTKPAQLDASTLDLGLVPGGWSFAYALPADCVPNGLRKLYPGVRNPRDDQETPFAIEYDGATDQVIVLTDDTAPEMIYTARIGNTQKFSATFARGVAETMGVDLIRALRKDLKLVPEQKQIAAQAIAVAQAAALRGQRPDRDPPPSWMANR